MTVTDPLATTTTTDYDANGHVSRYAYDADNRLASVSDAAGRVTVYGYDALSRPSTLSNPGLQANPLVTRTYTANGNLASLAIARSNSVADTTGFAYDGLDRLSVTTWPLGSTESLSYDADNHVVRRVTRKGDAISFAYDTLNRVCTKTYAAAAVACGGTSASYLVSYGYDLAGRLIAVNDNSAAIARPLPPGGAGTVQYLQTTSYDALNRPLNVDFGPAPAQTPPAAASSVTFSHAYDATNRRIGQTTSDTGWWAVPGAAATVAYTVNALNQYTAVGAVTPSYDGDGNLTFDGTFTYGYDPENRLVSASGPGLTASYAYDATGHRKSRTVNGGTTLLVGDGGGPDLLEYDGTSGQLLARTLAGPGANEPVGRLDLVAGSRTTFVPDIQGSILASLGSATGALIRQGYRPFGESAGTAVFGYTGQRLDAETGLYDYHARHYLPAWGRFIQPDPIGYAGGYHLYAYVNNDPLNGVDPNGLMLAAVGSYLSNSWDALSRAPGDIAGMAGNLVSSPGTFLTQAGPGLAGLGMSIPFVGAGAGAVGDAGNGFTTVYRAVGPAELADIQTTGVFRNLGSAEGKYFTTSGEAASSYAKQAVNAFGDQPYTLVQARAPNSIFEGLSPATVDRGIPALVIPNESLPGLTPSTMNYMPIPGAP